MFKYIFLEFLIIQAIFADDELNKNRFPYGFMIGAGSSAYQIEGAWNEDGKGENIWDRAVHTVPSPIKNNDTGDVACDSYHQYPEDVRLLKDLGVNTYRFSISWSRILPTGNKKDKSIPGVNYYFNLIRDLQDYDITPVVTIYHWDLPQALQDLGGWANEVIIDKYVDYVDVLFDTFGFEIKYWLTFNEPLQICQGGYGAGTQAPLIKSSGTADYQCAHNVLKAHARAWHLYDEKYRATQQGQVGITLDTVWYEPHTNTSDKDIEAAERMLQFNFGWFGHPIFLGDYPEVMKTKVSERSIAQGFKESRLPAFTNEEIEYIKNTSDFLGLNYYTSRQAYNINDEKKKEISYDADMEASSVQPADWESTASIWLKATPWGLRKLLNWVKNEYGNISIIVTGNGVSDYGITLLDDQRIRYIQSHLSNIRDAMDDGVNIIGYITWSLMDNFEWLQGYYKERFGLYRVEFSNDKRMRIAKKSVAYYRKFAIYRCIVDEPDCIE